MLMSEVSDFMTPHSTAMDGTYGINDAFGRQETAAVMYRAARPLIPIPMLSFQFRGAHTHVQFSKTRRA